MRKPIVFERCHDSYSVAITCVKCGKTTRIDITKQDCDNLILWKEGIIPLIQNAVPDMHIDDKEKLITSLCQECSDEIYATFK